MVDIFPSVERKDAFMVAAMGNKAEGEGMVYYMQMAKVLEKMMMTYDTQKKELSS